jgi:CheY-like chemotaxis protein
MPGAEASPRPALPQGLRVLLVDDEPGVAASTARLLQRLGCRVTVLGGPEAAGAAERFDGADFDVAMVDLTMPARDGLSVLASLRQDRPNLAAVLMSGALEAADPGRLASLRPLVQLAKPFSTDALERAVGAALLRSARTPGQTDASERRVTPLPVLGGRQGP